MRTNQVQALRNHPGGGKNPPLFDVNAYKSPTAACQHPPGNLIRSHSSDEFAIKIVHPFYNSPRLLAQDGAHNSLTLLGWALVMVLMVCVTVQDVGRVVA